MLKLKFVRREPKLWTRGHCFWCDVELSYVNVSDFYLEKYSGRFACYRCFKGILEHLKGR